MGALVGATYQSGQHTFGLSINAPSLHVLGRGHAALSAGYTDTMTTTATSTLLDGKFASYSPLRVNSGWAIELGRTTIELDGTLSFPLSKAYNADLIGSRADVNGAAISASPLHIVESDPTRWVANAGLGVEHFTSDVFSILGGVNTDFTAVESSALDKQRAWNFFSTRGSRLGGSLGIGSYGHGGELLMGFDGSYGWGDQAGGQPVPSAAPLDANVSQRRGSDVRCGRIDEHEDARASVRPGEGSGRSGGHACAFFDEPSASECTARASSAHPSGASGGDTARALRVANPREKPWEFDAAYDVHLSAV